MVTKSQTIWLSVFSVAIIVIISYPTLLGNFLNEKFGAAFVIRTIDDLDTEYLTITESKISNVARSTYVFPYDKLFYHTKLTCKVPELYQKC